MIEHETLKWYTENNHLYSITLLHTSVELTILWHHIAKMAVGNFCSLIQFLGGDLAMIILPSGREHDRVINPNPASNNSFDIYELWYLRTIGNSLSNSQMKNMCPENVSLQKKRKCL